MDNETVDDDIKGIVFDIRESKNGFTFYLETTEGKCERCFYREKPEDLKTYSVKGNFSDDNTIFFIEKMTLLEYCYNQ